jgi:Mg2+ and Co2+ transporter CorA
MQPQIDQLRTNCLFNKQLFEGMIRNIWDDPDTFTPEFADMIRDIVKDMIRPVDNRRIDEMVQQINDLNKSVEDIKYRIDELEQRVPEALSIYNLSEQIQECRKSLTHVRGELRNLTDTIGHIKNKHDNEDQSLAIRSTLSIIQDDVATLFKKSSSAHDLQQIAQSLRRIQEKLLPEFANEIRKFRIGM